MKRVTLVLSAVLLGALAARDAGAHIVPTGVGTQTWIDVRPRKIVLQFNLGFSSLLALGELKRADANKNGVIDADEVDPYLAALAPRIVPSLRLHLDGKPLPLVVRAHRAQGMRGPIDSVAFDTFFDFDVALPERLTPGPHELTYYDGTYANDTAQQLLYVIADRPQDFREFRVEQSNPSAQIQERPGAYELMGRDVTVRFDYRPAALERDRAEELFEPSLRGLHATVNALATTEARAAEADVAATAAGPVRFGGKSDGPALLASMAPNFDIGAPTAQERVPDATAGFARPLARDEETDEAQKMAEKAREPFSLVTLLLFLLWGVIHAKGPGHGKGMVAAYLLGTTGRVWDAVRLGLIVTFTHTFTLYTFGLGLIFLAERMGMGAEQQQRVNNRALFLITFGSGVGLALYGLVLAWRRKKNLERERARELVHAAKPRELAPPSTGRKLSLVAAAPVVEHGHGHEHGHSHSHENLSDEEHAALHAREAATKVATLRDLLSLGVTAGIVPCPAGVTLILFSLGNVGSGHSTLRTFVYLNAFSLGLGAMLIAIAVTMVFSKRYLEAALTEKRRRFLQTLPVYSALAIALLGGAQVYEAYDPNYASAIARISRFVSRPER